MKKDQPRTANRWDTVRPLRRVLVVVRSPAAFDRLDDIVPLLLHDLRLDVWFTVDPGSSFSGRLRERLSTAGALLVPWQEVDQHQFDLIIAASENSDFSRLRGPIVLFPHGAGYHRRSPRHPEWPSGLRKTALIQHDQVLPHSIVVADDAQVEIMRSVDPRLASHALVAGDPCLDRLRASMPHRNLHRRTYQADDRHLVLVCSTWGPNSLYGQRPDLAEQLVTSLPADEYRVVLTLHPNVWERHGSLQLTAWLRRATSSGLVVTAPTGDWRSAMLAADVVISDHGSLTCYAAAIGLPTLVAADGGDEVIPGSPMAELLGRLPRLTDDPRQELTGTLLAPTRSSSPPATDTLAEHLYTVLGLPVVADAPDRPAVPQPKIEAPSPLHFQVEVTTVLQQGKTAEITLERTTARWPHKSSFLTASEHCAEIPLLERAGTIYADHRFALPTAAANHARNLLSTFPGARVALAPLDGDRVVVAVKDTTLAARTTAPVSVTAAAIHWWSTVPQSQRPTTIHVRAGAVSGTVVIETAAPG